MLLICPYVPGKLRDETVAAISRYADGRMEVSMIELDPLDHYAYGRLLGDLWKAGRSFAIVEQDIVIRADVVNAFLNCSCEYGGFPYAVGTGVAVCLGCTRFRGRFTYRHPDAVSDAIAYGRTWKQLDVTLQRRILYEEHRQEPHICGAPVMHLNDAKQLRPGAPSKPVSMLPQGGQR